MQLTNLLFALGLVASVAANPVANPEGDVEARTLYNAKGCDWECKKWYPKCNNGWYPKCCSYRGDKNCKDWGEYYAKHHHSLPRRNLFTDETAGEWCEKSKSYCCWGGKCTWG
jgi:hypothetical protein